MFTCRSRNGSQDLSCWPELKLDNMTLKMLAWPKIKPQKFILGEPRHPLSLQPPISKKYNSKHGLWHLPAAQHFTPDDFTCIKTGHQQMLASRSVGLAQGCAPHAQTEASQVAPHLCSHMGTMRDPSCPCQKNDPPGSETSRGQVLVMLQWHGIIIQQGIRGFTVMSQFVAILMSLRKPLDWHKVHT